MLRFVEFKIWKVGLGLVRVVFLSCEVGRCFFRSGEVRYIAKEEGYSPTCIVVICPSFDSIPGNAVTIFPIVFRVLLLQGVCVLCCL